MKSNFENKSIKYQMQFHYNVLRNIIMVDTSHL